MMSRSSTNVHDAISQHIFTTRAMMTRLVTQPLLPSSISSAHGLEPSAHTLAYLSSSVATTAARVARLETRHLAVENRALALTSMQSRMHGPEVNIAESIAPINNAVAQHEAVLTDLLTVVSRMANKMDLQQQQHHQEATAQSAVADTRAAKRPSAVAAAAAAAAAGVSFLDGDVSPLTRASERNANNISGVSQQSRLQRAREEFMSRAGLSPVGTAAASSETASPTQDAAERRAGKQLAENGEDDGENDEEAEGGNTSSTTTTTSTTTTSRQPPQAPRDNNSSWGETDTSTSNLPQHIRFGSRGGGGAPAAGGSPNDPYSAAYRALRATLDG